VNEASDRSGTQPDLSILLTLTAFSMEKTAEARRNLLEQAFRRRDARALLLGHTDEVTSVAFSRDGRLLASGGVDDTVVLWDPTRRTRLATLANATQGVMSVAFSPDGRILAAAGRDGSVVLWDAVRHKRVTELKGHEAAVTSVAFSSDGRILASAGLDGIVVLWDPLRHSRLARMSGDRQGVTCLAFSANGRTLASAGASGVDLWDTVGHVRSAVLVRYAHTRAASVAFSPDGRMLISSPDDFGASLVIWDVAGLERIGKLTGVSMDSVQSSLAFSPDGRTVASPSDRGAVSIWDVRRRIRLQALTGVAGTVRGLAFSPDGKTLAAAGSDRTIALFDASVADLHGALAYDRERTFGGIASLAFSPDGKTLVSGGGDVVLWDAIRRSPLAILTPERQADVPTNVSNPDVTKRVVFRHGGSIVAWISRFGPEIVMWDVSRSRLIGKIPVAANDIAFSPDGRVLASVAKQLVLWDVATRRRISTLTGHKDAVDGVAFSPNGKLLASISSYSGSVFLWELPSRRKVGSIVLPAGIDYLARVSFSPDGRILAVGASRQIILWDVASHARIATLAKEDFFQQSIGGSSVVFSPDGRVLASAATGFISEVLLWDVDRGTSLGHLPGSNTVAFSPDGKVLALGKNEITLWKIDEEEWFRHLCAVVGRNLTYEEWDKFLPGWKYRKTCG
jgi:WD40 repeat protein